MANICYITFVIVFYPAYVYLFENKMVEIKNVMLTVVFVLIENRKQFEKYILGRVHRVSILEGPSAVYTPACVAGVYLIKFLIRNLSCTPCSKPSRTVRLLDVMYTMYARHPF